MSARRWPIITIALIVINVVCFLLTMTTISKESNQAAVTRMHILMLAASHPELTVKPETQAMIDTVKEKQPGIWKELSSEYRRVEDGWDARMRMAVETEQWQAEMTRLQEEYERLIKENLTENYGFVPARKNMLAYLTANFLHLGWMHLIGNMWFLWLAGFVLEDAWGRPLYIIFYLLAGIGALQFHAWMHPASLTPTLGASGAVAGLMGAFLVRFPKIRIEMAWIWILFFRIRMYRFKVPAYALLPFWVGTEALYGWVFGARTGVAHWAHVGGFLFGAVFALVVRASGIEKSLTAKVTEEMEFAHDPEIEQATELLHSGSLAEALPILKTYVSAKPDSVDGWTLLRQVYWKQNAMASSMEASQRLIALHAKSGEMGLAEQEFADFQKAGGRQLPAGLWLEFSKGYEHRREFDRALSEYENLARAYPNVREAVQAQLAAGTLLLKELHRTRNALKMLRAAESSSVPHAELDAEIQKYIREASALLPDMSLKGSGSLASAASVSPQLSFSSGQQGSAFEVDAGAALELQPIWASASAPSNTLAKVAPEANQDEPATIPANVANPRMPSASISPSPAIAAKPPAKPATWGSFDAPPVWGHGAKGDMVEKPSFTEEDVSGKH